MKLFINANRTGYSPCQIQHIMTVGELIAALEEFDEASVDVLRNCQEQKKEHKSDMHSCRQMNASESRGSR